MARLTISTLILLACTSVYASERKPIVDVDIGALTVETQKMAGDQSELDLVWWIPVEYWAATLRQSAGLPTAQMDDMINVLSQHSVLAVVQANISPFGSFSFVDKETIMDGMLVEMIDESNKVRTISHTEPSDPDMRLVLDQMKPMLSQAMGAMGQNFFFFPLPAFDEDGERSPSPYEKGRLRVTLQRGETASVIEIEMPLDSLFVPRECPNGKPAHVSWNYCPWGGEPLD